MRSSGLLGVFSLLFGSLSTVAMVQPVYAQNFGVLIQRKKIVLQRKLPPTGHIDGTTFKVVVTATGLQADLPTDLKSTLESLLIRNDSRLRSDDTHADTIITCRVTTYAQPQPQLTTQAGLKVGSKGGPVQNQQMERVTGLLTVSFQAKSARSGGSLAGDTVTAKFDQEYTAAGAQTGILHSVTHSVTHLAKGATEDDTPPTAAELHNKLIQEAAQQIAAHLVNTTEQVEVYLARGGGLDEADKLAEKKLWTRALEQLETMKPFDTKEEDAYRIYDLGVVNEALAYEAEDVQKARKFLQEASIDYGKAIDEKPTEKYFMQPQTRIDTALAHYKIIGEQRAPAPSAIASSGPQPARATSAAASVPVSRSLSSSHGAAGSAPASAAASPADALTNDQVVSMVAAKMDEANIIDTIQHASAVKFDLTVQGQIALSKSGVSGRVLSAMKTRARTSVSHRSTGQGS